MILGISGVAGSGKSTVAKMLSKHNVIEVAFADPIKRAAMEWWGFSYSQLWGPSEMRNEIDPRYNISPRQVLQEIGTGIGRKIYKDTWVDIGFNTAKTLLQKPMSLDYIDYKGIVDKKRDNPISGIIFSDARYTNEILAIKKKGGKLIRIKRPGCGLKGNIAKHCSELDHLSWPDESFDYVIINNYDLAYLHSQLDNLINYFNINIRYPKQLELFR